MSQITLPWIPTDTDALRQYRRKAIARLALGGIVLLAMAGAVYSLGDVNTANRIADWKVFLVILGVIGPGATGAVLLLGAMAVAGFRGLVAIFRQTWVPFGIFIASIIAICLLVWAHSWLFDFIKAVQADASVNSPEGSLLGGELTVQEVYSVIAPSFPVPLAAYLLWPLQFPIVRDLVALGGVVGFISIIPGFGIWWERKVAGRIQSRLGPMRVGGWHGWAQSAADGIKLLFKEDLIPPEGDAILFRLAPYLALVPAVCAFLALPFAGAYVFRDLDVALLFILAMLGIEVVGVILAGWASNNKWSVYGAMREACQMVSYEIPMGMALLVPVMMAGSLKLTTICDAQAGWFGSWFVFRNPWCFLAFIAYYTASLASCKRAPFDLPESESELVAGFHTEYSGFRWSLFFFAEYAAMFVVSGLAVILFLGGWKSPLPADWAPQGAGFVARLIRGLFFDGPILFVLKGAFLFYAQLWIRWTLPRVRIDQVLYGCVQVLLPLMMGILLANTLWILGVNKFAFLRGFDTVLRYFLVAVGAFVTIGMLFIATYGYVNRRTLPGPLVIEHLPGA